MKAINLLLMTFLFFINFTSAQVGIGTTSPDASSELEISSPTNDKGVLIPRMSEAQRNAIVLPATSLLIYQTDNTPGFYYFNGTIWVGMTAGASTNWTLLGNSGTVPTTNFIGTIDDIDLVVRRKDLRAGFIGNPIGALSTTINVKNTSFGANTLLNPATSYRNTALGTNIMTNNTSGKVNVAVGDAAMNSNTSGSDNVAIGVGSLFNNTTGINNTALGRNALTTATSNNNTAIGHSSLLNTTSGTANNANGVNSLFKNTTGSNNTASGAQALVNNTVGANNTAMGFQALAGNPSLAGNPNVTIGANNTSVGYQSLFNNLVGANNVAFGHQAGFNELGSDKLYIENTNADANNALIYGEFTAGAKKLRTNSEFQIGNPALTGYAFPITRPATVAGQVLQYNAVGAVSFQAPATALNNYAWLTTGNSGMTANFIGTTDANPLVFRSSNTERMRILQTTGEVVVGATAPIFAGDKFSAVATGAQFAINGYSSLTGVGIYGDNTGTGISVFGNNTGGGTGVQGQSTLTGVGVIGFNSGTGVGVQGQSVSTGLGVFGLNTATGSGVRGQSGSTGNGVFGTNSATGVGVRGQSVLTGIGVAGFNSGTGVGVQGQSVTTGIGLLGFNTGTGVGVQGQNSSTGPAIVGFNTGTGNGVVGQTPAGSVAFAVFANGNMGASGTKPFYIDHPTDPENKYLRHFALESNEVLNVYRGNVVLDNQGKATVELPAYFDDVNINFSYNLTSIGSKSDVFIKEEIKNNKFQIAGGNPNQKISWQVYAERNDAYLQKYPDNKSVEVDKKENEKGKYLMPDLFNQSKDKGIYFDKKEEKINEAVEIKLTDSKTKK